MAEMLFFSLVVSCYISSRDSTASVMQHQATQNKLVTWLFFGWLLYPYLLITHHPITLSPYHHNHLITLLPYHSNTLTTDRLITPSPISLITPLSYHPLTTIIP